jgi:glucosamine--fructose-6-phosphate aminotransferase (isomerizing)
MLEYIHEGPRALALTLEANEDRIHEVAELVKKGSIDRIIMTGIGSSYTSSMMSAPLFVCHSPVPVQVVESSEFQNLPKRLVNKRTMIVAISRSGERGVVTNLLKEAVQNGACGVVVTGVADSLMAKQARFAIITKEGPEITFPKTKSVVTCTGVLMRLALALAEADDTTAGKRLLELKDMPAVLERTFDHIESDLSKLIPTIESRELVAIVGTGSNYGVALEGAMKLQEASYVPSHGERTNAFLNGPIGAMNAKWLVVALITNQDKDLSEKVLHISQNLEARTLCVIEPGLSITEKPDHCLTLPAKVDGFLAALVYLLPMQLLAYFRTVARGMNPDAPTSMNSILEAILAPGRDEPEFRKGLLQTS